MPQQDLSFQAFKHAVDAVDELLHVELQGEGEPLLHSQFFEMVEYLHVKHPGVKVSFITNGSLFTKGNIQKILSANIHRILVSIESADNDGFRDIRGGKLERVVRGLEALVDAREKWKGCVPAIGFAVTVLKDTLHQIKPIAELYKRLGMDGGLSIQPLQTMGAYTEVYDQAMLNQRMTKDDFQEFRQIIASDRDVATTVAKPSLKVGFYEEMYASEFVQGSACPWLDSGLYVTSKGAATSCCFVKDEKRFGLGELSKNHLGSIKQAQVKLQETLVKGQLPLQCKGCGVANNILRQSRN